MVHGSSGICKYGIRRFLQKNFFPFTKGRNCEWEEGGRMVPWWAVIIGLVAGIVIGFIIIALISANDEL